MRDKGHTYILTHLIVGESVLERGSGWGGGKSQHAHRDVVVLDGWEVGTPASHPCLSHLHLSQCLSCDGEFAQKKGVDSGWDDGRRGGWGWAISSHRLEVVALGWPRGWAPCSAWVGYDERDMPI